MTTVPATTTPSIESRRRTFGRWMLTFAGFPLGGVTAELIVGPVDSRGAALLGGLITGSILGAVQAWGLGRRRPPVDLWILATGLGLMVGLAMGAASVGYRTDTGALALQGVISGLAVGMAQAFVLRLRIGNLAFAWPPLLAAVWALGWTITTSIGVQVDEQFTVFGSSGAVVVTALTAVLPFALRRTERNAR